MTTPPSTKSPSGDSSRSDPVDTGPSSLPDSELFRDTTVKKVSSRHSPYGQMGQRYLTSGKRISMRLWQEEPVSEDEPHRRVYETIGYVISGRAELHVEGQKLVLEPGDCWLVPPGAKHFYRILEPFTAIEATAPPAEVHDRDADPEATVRRTH